MAGFQNSGQFDTLCILQLVNVPNNFIYISAALGKAKSKKTNKHKTNTIVAPHVHSVSFAILISTTSTTMTIYHFEQRQVSQQNPQNLL